MRNNLRFLLSYVPDLIQVLFEGGLRAAWECAQIAVGAVTYRPSAHDIRVRTIFNAMTDAEMDALLKTDWYGADLICAAVARRIGIK